MRSSVTFSGPDPTEVHPEPPDAFNNTSILWRNLIDQRTWAWQTGITKLSIEISQESTLQYKYLNFRHYGEVDIGVDVPVWPREWVVSAFTLDREKGLSFIETPVEVQEKTKLEKWFIAEFYFSFQFDATRFFFMMLEAPPSLKRGEQIGIQMTVFNRWEQTFDVRKHNCNSMVLML